MEFRKLMKYVVVAGLMGAIFMTPVTEAVAAVSGEEKDDGPTEEERAEEARQKKVQEEVENMIKEATAPVNKTVAGVKSAVDGYYFAKKVQGVALTPSIPGTGSFVKVADTDATKSSAAVAVANNVAASFSGTVGPCINVYYGKMAGGKFTSSTEGTAGTISIGIPADFQTAGMDYSIVAVYAGGAYKVFNNTSTIASVVTANVEQAASSNVMYAVVKSPAGTAPVQAANNATDSTTNNKTDRTANNSADKDKKKSESASAGSSTGASDKTTEKASESASTGASDKTSNKTSDTASDSASTGASDKTSKTSEKASDSASTESSR
ncbi:hypothetical protein [Butyrivibrio sp. AE2005]|uniref:hypothetical protein n=1 Tax=Butyrivibrio sp. AE2005 TaxID=1496722 RepID=UPI00047D4D7A|nr:hypothetical protein [Butyrivibrio sp. AE2005]